VRRELFVAEYPTGRLLIMCVTGWVMFFMVTSNFIFACIFCRITRQDNAFMNWREYFKKSKCLIQFIGVVLNWKFQRLFYSRFFGFDHFSANFSNLKRFLNWMMCFAILNIVFCILPLIIIDILGLLILGWGSQLYITIIETLVLSIIMLLATLIEICCSRNLAKDYYKIDGVEAIKPDDDSEDIEAVQRKMREDALRGIMAAIEDGEHGVFTEHHEDEMATEHMRLNRAAPDASDIENFESREIHPMVKHLNFDDPEFIPQDNCYAESKTANPNSKQKNKQFKDSET
jgi:hypothetical protein